MCLSRLLFTLAVASVLLSSCSTNYSCNPESPYQLRDSAVAASIAKWYDNHAGVISLTYDSGSPEGKTDNKVQMLARAYGVPISYEFVSASFRKYSYLSHYLKNVMIPMGLRTFGHGDEHVNHDSMTYEQALESFTRCFQTMTDFGLKPVSYAYPGGWCFEEETRRALKNSGFLNGRKFGRGDYLNPYIVPDTVSEPKDWFYLPTLVMEGYYINNCEPCVGSPEELGMYLDEAMRRKAWIITTYHSIYDWDEPQGYYRLGDFERDLQEIKKRDVWATSMDEATLYIVERKQATVTATWHINDAVEGVPSISVHLQDGLPNDRFIQPLTVLFSAPQSWVGKTIGVYANKTLQQTFLLRSAQVKVSLQPCETVYTLKPVDL